MPNFNINIDHQAIHDTDLNSFLNCDKEQLSDILNKYGITTIYFPIDGTRRYFISSTGIDYQDPDFLKKYLEFSQKTSIEIFEKLFDLQIKNIIVLLMDDTAFERGSEYLNNAIKFGIQPLLTSELYKEFYKSYDVNLFFAGFNHLYCDYEFSDLYEEMIKTNYSSTPGVRNLIFYTGTSQQLQLFDLIKDHYDEDFTLQNLIDRIYPLDLPKIDLAIYYGYPRDKITPLFLTGSSVNFYSMTPSLGLSERQLKKSLFYTIRTKTTIKDDYIRYTKDQIDLKRESMALLYKNIDFIGEFSYLD